jgi:hypothetical protein
LPERSGCFCATWTAESCRFSDMQSAHASLQQNRSGGGERQSR